MKTFSTLTAFIAFPLFSVTLAAAPAPDFHDHLGIQLWSVRAQIKESLPAALDLVKGYGVTEIEAFVIAGVTAPQLVQELQSRGLKAVSTHAGYPILEKDISAAIADAKTLGTKFLICPYPKTDKNKAVTEEIAHAMAADFNKWGEACRAAGIRFGFHPHGLEFRPTAAGNSETVFDILVRETKPELVCFEMDVFWAFHAGQDPVKLLAKYPNRWALLHVKDIRKGAVTGLSSGSAPPTDNVTVGAGQINWPEVLRAARKIGVQYYLLEDETPTPLQCIPDSLKYLRALKL
jgi:sugar phosphate isomerase/epimerase